MAVAVPRYSVDDLASLPDDGNRYELLDGILLVTPAPSLGHQAVVSRLMAALQGYLGGEAMVYSPGAVEIRPRVHLEPDLLVVPASEPLTRWDAVRTWWLAVEVSGRGSRIYDRNFKFAAYLALGVQEVWLIDLTDRTVTAQPAAGTKVRSSRRLTWRPAKFNHPLTLDLPPLFEGITAPD